MPHNKEIMGTGDRQLQQARKDEKLIEEDQRTRKEKRGSVARANCSIVCALCMGAGQESLPHSPQEGERTDGIWCSVETLPSGLDLAIHSQLGGGRQNML